jgi:ABC-type sugar transport system substrate-binding protein
MTRVLMAFASLLLWSVQTPAQELQPAAPQRVKAIFVNPGKVGEVFWDLVSDTMRAAARQLDIDVEIVYSERNRRTLIELGMAAVNSTTPPDYLIIVNEESAATPIVEAADAAGIKTFLLSNAFTGAEAERYGAPRRVLGNWIGSLTPDMTAAGTRMAKALVEDGLRNERLAADGKLHLLALGGDERTPNSIERTQGFTSFVAQRSDVVVDRLLFANWNAAEAETLTNRYLLWAQRLGIRPGGVWAANDPIAIGAMKAIDQSGLVPGRDIGVVGLNWSPEALAEVKAGRMLLTDGGHFFEGGWSMVMLRDHADGCDFAKGSAARVFPLASIDRASLPEVEELITSRRFERIRFGEFRATGHGDCGRYDFSLNALLRATRPPTAN